MSDTIRLGTIGSGMIVRAILGHVLHSDTISLTAVYSRSQETGQALAREFGAEAVFTDLDAFLADPGFDTVYIASPNLLHFEQAKKALLAGKHVICEKPFCVRQEEARELVGLARARGLTLVDATPTAFLPNLDLLRQALSRIGRVRLVLGNYSQYSSRYDALLAGKTPNVFNPAFGGGCLMDINYYNAYLTVLLFGRPRDAAYAPNLHPNGIDTSGVLTFQYDGFVCSLAGAKDTWGENFYQIEGEKGYIRIPGGSNGLASIEVVTRDGQETLNAQENPDRWFYEVQGLASLLALRDPTLFDSGLDTMLETIRLLEEVRRKAGIRFPGD